MEKTESIKDHQNHQEKQFAHSNGEGEDKRSENSGREDERAGNLEKIFTVLSLILITAIVVYLGKESLATQTPAAFILKPADPIKRGDFKAIDVYIENTGDRAAKAVNLKGEVPGPDGKPVEAEATLDWLPGRSTRRASLIFPPDAPTTAPQLEIIGYEEP